MKLVEIIRFFFFSTTSLCESSGGHFAQQLSFVEPTFQQLMTPEAHGPVTIYRPTNEISNETSILLQTKIMEACKYANWTNLQTLVTAHGEPMKAHDKVWWYFIQGMSANFRGQYDVAYHFCQEAERVAEVDLHLIWSCMGVAANHLKNYEVAILYFEKVILETVTSLTSSPNKLTGFTTSPKDDNSKNNSQDNDNNNNENKTNKDSNSHKDKMNDQDDADDRQMQPVISSLTSLGFKSDLVDAIYNLLSTYHYSNKISLCLDLISTALGWPLPTKGVGTSLVLILAFISYDSQTAVRRLHEVEVAGLQAGLFKLANGTSLLGEIQRIQRNGLKLLDPALQCVSQSSHPLVIRDRNNGFQAFSYVLNGAPPLQFHQISESLYVDPYGDVVDEEGNKEEQGSSVVPVSQMKDKDVISDDVPITYSKYILITQFYSPHDKDMHQNIVRSLEKNLQNPFIEIVLLITNQLYDLQNLENSHKIRQITIKSRLTFSRAFEFANLRYPSRVVILSNSDIYFDQTLGNLSHYHSLLQVDSTHKPQQQRHQNQHIITLTKWRHAQSSIRLSLRTDSQDVWIFQTPIPRQIVSETNFYLGAPRCDNRLARIFDDFNYSVINPIYGIHAVEIDSRIRHEAYGYEGAVLGPTKQVLYTLSL